MATKLNTFVMILTAMGLFGITPFAPLASAAEPFGDAFLKNHCYDCHGDGVKKGGLSIEKLGRDLSDAETMRLWVLIHDRVTAGQMPPKKQTRPKPAESRAFLKSLSSTLTQAHTKQREVVLRRLNRIEGAIAVTAYALYIIRLL